MYSQLVKVVKECVPNQLWHKQVERVILRCLVALPRSRANIPVKSIPALAKISFNIRRGERLIVRRS